MCSNKSTPELMETAADLLYSLRSRIGEGAPCAECEWLGSWEGMTCARCEETFDALHRGINQTLNALAALEV